MYHVIHHHLSSLRHGTHKAAGDWFETNSQNQKHYSEGGKKIRGCRGLLVRFKPWLNELASSHKWTQVELAWRLALGGQTDSQVFSQVHASRKKKTFQGRHIQYFIG